MKRLPLELIYGFVTALLLGAMTVLANTDLPEQSRLIMFFVWRGPWLVPYLAYMGSGIHKRRRGSKEKPMGIQFITALWTLGSAILITSILWLVNLSFDLPFNPAEAGVIMTVGLWEDMIKGLFLSMITVTLLPRSMMDKLEKRIKTK